MQENFVLNERSVSQNPAIEVLKRMGYTYLSREECMALRDNSFGVLLKPILKIQLEKLNSFEYGGEKRSFSDANILRAVDELDEPLTDGLIKTSEKIYDALMLGKSYAEQTKDGTIKSFNLKYIDWDNPENNVFHVTEEFSVESWDRLHNARPDIVLFVNGIPFGVIECKAPYIPLEQAIEQTVRNQGADYVPQLYKFTQILMAVNMSGAQYATCGTGKKFWSVWKEENKNFLDTALEKCVVGRMPTEQDRAIISLFSKERLLELTQFFVLYDANVKKVCRYQQHFAVKEIIKTIHQNDSRGNRQSGVIWHTQGSGKSLTMVMLSKYILMKLAGRPRIVVVTDRKELDRQIVQTFAHTRLKPARATSGKHLITLINSDAVDVVTSIINKFNTVEVSGLKNYSRDIFVLVDESHRSNYGAMAAKMRAVFPNACYIGFTGTPLMKSEKNTMAKFGKLIHKYTIADGVADHAIVPLIYEGRFVEQSVDEENIDLWFDQTTKRLTSEQRADLSNKWSSIQRLTSTDARIRRIALDINQHFCEALKSTGFKAMLACNYKKDAIRYLSCFEQMGDLKCAVVISPPDVREGQEDVDESTDDVVLSYWQRMMKEYGDPDTYEETIKEQFKHGEIDLLIVCSKLLTGFDAPLTQVLYIDKELKDHGLLQAIARTNRLYEGKDFGWIIDYRGLLKKLDDAMELYGGAGLENFDSEDIKGVVVDVMASISRVREAHSQMLDLFSGINKEDEEAIQRALEEDEKRKNFYELLCAFGRSLRVVINSEQVIQAITRDELEILKSDFIRFSKTRRAVRVRYCDAIDNREYEKQMQGLLDQHMRVAGLKQITPPVDILDESGMEEQLEELGSISAKAAAIRSHLAKSIKQHYDENPAYYDNFSKKIKNALDLYKAQVITESEYLLKMREIMEEYRKGVTDIKYPESIKGNLHAQAFFGVVAAILEPVINMGESFDLIGEVSLKIAEIIEKHNAVDWQTNTAIHNKIAQDIDDLFYFYEKEGKLRLDFETIDKIIENVKTVALRRF